MRRLTEFPYLLLSLTPFHTHMFTTAKPTYFSPPADGPIAFSHVNVDPATGEQPKNWNEDVRVVQIEDIRGKEHEFSLDISGFQYYRHPAKHTMFTDDKEIEEGYGKCRTP